MVVRSMYTEKDKSGNKDDRAWEEEEDARGQLHSHITTHGVRGKVRYT